MSRRCLNPRSRTLTFLDVVEILDPSPDRTTWPSSLQSLYPRVPCRHLDLSLQSPVLSLVPRFQVPRRSGIGVTKTTNSGSTRAVPVFHVQTLCSFVSHRFLHSKPHTRVHPTDTVIPVPVRTTTLPIVEVKVLLCYRWRKTSYKVSLILSLLTTNGVTVFNSYSKRFVRLLLTPPWVGHRLWLSVL